ncbi:uncharacterized protein BDW43DRAFT_316218 [Aspergillus alliaceus]|uniref:uncharacterized protein n=1 Tax=Petromyces alliaceus TaxID=209559 RepID=UPI0012A6AB03|nr:uncharacterized protein BDW43DRAFT_316218 [Aspergillus alliaceus]KAB8228119.1 hypothetical protein BDW43DRAFT_316218 [Aspergillus alliaceus]
MWNLAPAEIKSKLQGMRSHSEKLESKYASSPFPVSYSVSNGAHPIEVCNLLSLGQPIMKIEGLDGRLIDSKGEYTAAAYFQDHPSLVRAGAIGRVKMTGPRTAAQGAYAEKVAEYLVQMVEDMGLRTRLDIE